MGVPGEETGGWERGGELGGRWGTLSQGNWTWARASVLEGGASRCLAVA